ncbi:MAG: hypothetical protein VR71_10515 [Roseovarius sp. BRH_c41]|uniref:phage tail fiber protein n=1 Tax=Roseovarius sp. BRH_c41 TaxID=1629709 RepID=UPI0005F1E2D9|nr:hypothetical protein [Roseovarius sp. BRH_c41]KJS43405.1 MAG: hypothetical protein VR71_10515 [Roseovarius sp. BRH_c41]
MSTFSTYLEAAVLNHVFRNTAITSPASVHLALFTAAPTDAGGGTEVTGSGYARAAVTFGAPAADPADGTRQAVLNSAEIVFATTHDPVQSVVAVGYYDAATAGNLLTWSAITAADLGVGAEIKFPASSLNVFLS